MDKEKAAKQFIKLVEIVEKLRGPDGCPWDKEQTSASLLPYFLEETYEVIESIDEQNWETLKEELGDVLLHIVLQGQISMEEKRFDLLDSIKNVNKKLIKRHPHVFGDEKTKASFEAKQNWESIKHKEKNRKSRLDGVPIALPALTRAHRLQEKASYVGFDWDNKIEVLLKLNEEIRELQIAFESNNINNLEEELGDVLFSVVNLARHMDLDSEDLLRKANKKFIERFMEIENILAKKGMDIENASIKEMNEIWEDSKNKKK